ncbi:MAG: DUF3971 domain-containing protein [Pseudomonadota bacterium]
MSSSEQRRGAVGRGVKRAAQASRSAFLWFVFFSICLVAVLLSAARWWLPSVVDRNQHSLVQRIGDNMGVELGADSARLNWSHWGPSLHLDGLRVDLPGVEAPLTLDRVEASLDLRQLVQYRKLIVDEVTLKGLAIEIGRDKDGAWSVALDRGQSSGTGLQTTLAALARFGWINISEASLRWRDAVSNQTYDVDNIAIVANNQDGQLRVSVEADLPGDVGGHIRAVANVSGDADNGFQGQSYASVDRVELRTLSSLLNARDIVPVGEIRDVQLWSRIESGRFADFQYQLSGDRVALEDSAQQTRWYLDFFSATGGWNRTETGWRAWLDDTVLAGDGVAWRPGLTTLDWQRDTLVGTGQLLRIEEVRDLMLPWRHLPSLAGVANWLEGSLPSGELALWKLSLPLSPPRPSVTEETPASTDAVGDAAFVLPEGMQFEGVVTGWRNTRFGALPGLENIDAALRVNNGRFSARVEGEGSVLDAPALFRTPLLFDQVAGQIDGELSAAGRWISTDDVLIDTPHFQMLAQVSAARSHDDRGTDLDVRGSIRDLDGRYLSTYYPQGAMPERLQKWLERSLQGGRVPRGDFLMLGNTADYPFRANEGRLDVRLDVEDLAMEYNTVWPVLTAMNGSFRLDGIGVNYTGEAQILGGALRNVDARIPDVRASRMRIDSSWSGDSETLINWLRQGPLAQAVGRHFRDVEIAGPVTLQIAPDFGLRPNMPATIEGVAQFRDARFELTGPELVFEGVSARVPFNQRGLLGHELEGTFLGNPIQVAVTTSDDQRALRAEALTDVDLGLWLSDRGIPIAEWVDGRSRWDVVVDVTPAVSGGPTQVAFNAVSDLRGVQVTAPEPVAKDAAVGKALRVGATIGSAATDQWQLTYGEDTTVAFSMRRGALEAMAIGAGSPAPALPERGVRARVDWPRADLERWYTALDRCSLSGEGEDGVSVDVYARVDAGAWLGVPIGEVTLQLAEVADAVEGQVAGDVVDGRFRYTGGARPSLQADLTRVDVTPLMDGEFEISESPPSHPRDYPATRIGVRELRVDNLRFTDVDIATQPTPNGLELTELVARSPLYTAQGAGRWEQSEAGEDISHLELFAHSNDVGLAVADMGSVGTLSGGQGQLSVSGTWDDVIWAPDLASLAGTMRFDLKDGRVNGLDPGAGRVFGLLALQTLPQRLALDFSDLGDGLGYEAVRGEFELGDGKATAKALLLEGPVGVVSVVGPIDFLNRSYDQRIVVLPNVGGSLPLIGAFVGGPLTAASVFLADKVLRGMGVDVNQFGRRDYSLTGDFDAPELTQILLENSAAATSGSNVDR